jgi:hypothetical protein
VDVHAIGVEETDVVGFDRRRGRALAAAVGALTIPSATAPSAAAPIPTAATARLAFGEGVVSLLMWSFRMVSAERAPGAQAALSTFVVSRA